MNDVDVIYTAIAKLWKNYSCMTHAYQRQNFLKGLRVLTETVGEAEFCSPEEFADWYKIEIKLAHDLVGAL